MYDHALRVGMGPFATFYVLIVELYFPNMSWLIIRNNVRLFMFFL
jgi:hypothetical protein